MELRFLNKAYCPLIQTQFRQNALTLFFTFHIFTSSCFSFHVVLKHHSNKTDYIVATSHQLRLGHLSSKRGK